MKRGREGDEDDFDEPPSKVCRTINVDRFSKLSDEVLVRILSFLPISSLLVCQRYAATTRLFCAFTDMQDFLKSLVV